MKTKLVYVLTCAAEAYYIEQALMSIYTARHYNPEAQIILITDDLTDGLLCGTRGQLLRYITEKVVVPFEDASLSMMYRSRWLKTSVRGLISGDFLFIDTDTIINGSLASIDFCGANVAAVWESHLPVAQFNAAMVEEIRPKAQALGWDIDKEEYYYSSGVIYVKDTSPCHRLYTDWHQVWLSGTEKGIFIDQPSLAKANIMQGRILSRLDDVWNCISFTQPLFAKEAHILHFTAYRNTSYLFTERMYRLVRAEGMGNSFVVNSVLHPQDTYYPYHNQLYLLRPKKYLKLLGELRKNVKSYAQNLDVSFTDYPCLNRLDCVVQWLYVKGFYGLGSMLKLLRSWYYVKLSGKYRFTENICSI